MKSRLKLPLLSDDKNFYPSNSECTWCKKKNVGEPHTFVALTAGSVLETKYLRKPFNLKRLEAYFDIIFHGAHDNGIGEKRDAFKRTVIAERVLKGDFQILFCSTKCLRNFFNFVVDDLENKIKNV